jgi:hypothetical protein
MENNSSPMELSAEDISLGMKNERTVIIESANPVYNGKAVRIRTLRGREFRQITAKVHVGPEDLAGNFMLAMEAAKIGVVTPGIAAKIEDLDHDIILQVGEAIIAASQPDEEKTENFSNQKRDKLPT